MPPLIRRMTERNWSNVCAVLVCLSLGACASSRNFTACPTVKERNQAFAEELADQVEALPLPRYWAVMEATLEWYSLRSQIAVCRAHE